MNKRLGDFDFYYKDEDNDAFTNFFNYYFIERIISCHELQNIVVLENNSLLCRFCNKGYPHVAFNNIAHLAPQILGNKYLISKFECDNCNERFGKYDNELHNFLNVSRVFNYFNTGKNVTYHSNQKKLIAKTQTSITETPHVLFYTNDFSNQVIDLDEKTGEGKFEFETGAYRPLSVYKSFLKIGLSLISYEDCKYYKKAFSFLTTRKLDNDYKELFQIMEHQYDYGISQNNLTLILHKKKNTKDNIPTHMIEIRYCNHIFQLFLPYNSLDETFYHKEVHLNFRPPVFQSNEDLNSIKVRSQNIDLSATEKRKDQKQLLIKLSPEDLKKSSYTKLEDTGVDAKQIFT